MAISIEIDSSDSNRSGVDLRFGGQEGLQDGEINGLHSLPLPCAEVESTEVAVERLRAAAGIVCL